MPRIYIAGAHSRGITTGYYLKYLDPTVEIVAYLYDNEEDNPRDIDGVPVLRIEEAANFETDCPVYLGVRGAGFERLTSSLRARGLETIIPVDAELDMDLRNRFLRSYYASTGREYVKINDMPAGNEVSKAVVYVANSIYDKPLENGYSFADYEKILQVGTALTKDRLNTDFYDNTGDNISVRNKQFCELTALYWIWKNVSEDIVGLAHYRRHFILPDDWVGRMLANDIDVILPVPLYVYPSLEGNYRARHVGINWDNMLGFIKNNYPDDYPEASMFFKETFLYSPCNMMIARKRVLGDLCEWLFPIIFNVVSKGGALEDSYQNRYPGFISERLITYFFEKNRDRYKAIYADKNFLE